MDKSLLDLMIRRVPGLKAEEQIRLERKFAREEDFSTLSKKDIENILGRAIKGPLWKMTELRALAEKDAAAAMKRGIRWVSWREGAYPPLLREIFDPPALLFYRGLLPNPEKPLAAVVGTRKPSSPAAARAFALGRELGEAGIAVVSGLALGIDSLAHRGNIEGRASTVAVLGSGPDQVYPASNRELARRILENGGALLSEYLPGEAPRKWHFPARNRIISGIARGTVVVEAPLKSGALITARFALEQNRDVWVTNTGVLSPQGEGTARLAEEGARVISSARELLAEWGMTSAGDKGVKEQKLPLLDGGSREGSDLASSLAEYLNIKL
jgi:DNA processing protein